MTQSMNQIPAPNLLPQSRINARKRDGAIRLWSFVVVALVILIAIPSTMLSIHLRTSKPVDNDHITRFVSDLDQLRAAIPPLKKQLAELETASESQKRAQTRIQWTSVLNHLASITDNSVRIHAFNASIITAVDSQTIEITLDARTKTLSKAREFLVLVESAGLFDQVEMIESRRMSSAPDSPVNSTIRAKIVSQQPAGATP